MTNLLPCHYTSLISAVIIPCHNEVLHELSLVTYRARPARGRCLGVESRTRTDLCLGGHLLFIVQTLLLLGYKPIV